MKTIICTGDSHTWGQGIPGLESTFSPPVAVGDLRLVSFKYDSYVNLLRHMVNQKVVGSAQEVEGGLLCSKVNAKLIRIQLLSSQAASAAAIYIDGALQREVSLKKGIYHTLSIFCDKDGEHELEIHTEWGAVSLYRIELYSGDAAVVNCGIGSCPTFKFYTDYWDTYVTELRPSVVVLEPHTINDWLAGDPPSVHNKRLKSMVEKLRAADCDVVMLTVSPILGSQDIPFNKVAYNLYVEEGRRVANECGISICDANAVMTRRMEGLTEDESRSLLFNDNWHVNELGHRIYAESAYDTLVQNNLI